MYLEKRPTCVTVIGWAWIIVGGLMILSATMSLFTLGMIRNMALDEPDLPFIFKKFELIVIIQIGVGLLGLISGINFLMLKAWARNVLEGLTWMLLVFVLGFTVFWVFTWVSMTSRHDPPGFGIMGAAMGVVFMAIYAVPLGIMLKYMRGRKVRNAVSGTADQSPPA